jgi:WD40 repeat protein
LTGEIAKKLCGHTNVVRDVSWHPSKSFLLSTSWDGGIIAWDFARK